LRFVDSNVFLHVFLTPRRELTQDEAGVKEASKAIVKGIEEGEEVGHDRHPHLRGGEHR
jgi:hypothetical protein